MIEQVRSYLRKLRLLQAGDRVAVAVSGGADSVALLRVLLELRKELGLVLSVAHFHHQIRGAEADADQQFVGDLGSKFALELHTGTADVPAFARENKISVETAARELRHGWFAQLIKDGKTDKIATAHTLDDQAETVLMRIIRGAGARGLAGIAPWQAEKHLVRPLLKISRRDVEAYLTGMGQSWRDDSSNVDSAHTRNRVRGQLLPLLEKEFNPSTREVLADLAEIAGAEADYWNSMLATLIPRLLHQGKPSRSGRSASGEAAEIVALDLSAFRSLPLALQRQALHHTAQRLGVMLEYKHIQALIELAIAPKPGTPMQLPGGLEAASTFREIHFRRQQQLPVAGGYRYALHVPGEVYVSELAATLRAQVIPDGKPTLAGYNQAQLLDRALLAPAVTVRNWEAGDRFFPAHTRSPRKVKELLQAGRLGKPLSQTERKTWPVIESAGQIVWMKGYPVPQAYAHLSGEAVLIEICTDSGANHEP